MLTEIPPPEKCHHALTFARYGSDETGWQEKLGLQINQAGVFHCFFLEDADFTVETIEDIKKKLAEPLSGKEQLGVATGQYLR
jgi:hypothetical protein